MTEDDAIRALSREISKCCHKKNPVVVASALATVIGLLVLQFSEESEADALSGIDALTADARDYVRLAFAHKGTAQ